MSADVWAMCLAWESWQWNSARCYRGYFRDMGDHDMRKHEQRSMNLRKRHVLTLLNLWPMVTK